MKITCPIIACLSLAVLFSGCFSNRVGGKKLARYNPRVGDRSPWLWKADSAQTDTSAAEDSGVSGQNVNRSLRPLKSGDNIVIYLRGIPRHEDIKDVVDEFGNITLPLIGTVKVEGKRTSEAEKIIEKMYVEDGYYTKINVIMVAQGGEYFVRGEVKTVGKYPLSGDRTLLQAITAAGGYTEYANYRKIRVIRGKEVLCFDAKKIERRKVEDPIIKSGDIIVVPRRIW